MSSFRFRAVLPSHGDLLYGNLVLAARMDGLYLESLIRHQIDVWTAWQINQLGVRSVYTELYNIFRDASIPAICFRCFILPLTEYCAIAWSSASACHLHFLDGVMKATSFLFVCLGRLAIVVVSGVYAITPHPSVASMLPGPHVLTRNVPLALYLRSPWWQPIHIRTSQLQRWFLPHNVELCNSLSKDTYTYCLWHNFQMYE